MTYPLPKRCAREDREKQLILTAIAIIKEEGTENLTRAKIADRVNISPALVNAVFGTMEGLREAIISYAMENLAEDPDNDVLLKFVADGLISGSATAKQAPKWLKERAIASVI